MLRMSRVLVGVANALWTSEPDRSSAWHGYAVSSVGDVNGDGYSDVIVGAPNYGADVGFAEGRASVYFGSATGLATTPGWTADGGQASAEFGSTVVGGGDV